MGSRARGGQARLAALAAGVACAAAYCGPAGAAERPAPAGAYFGVNAQILFGKFQRSAWGRPLDTAASLGMRAVRAEAPWYLAEPRAPANGVHDFEWDWFDAVAEELARRGIRWFPVLDFSAPWASSLLSDMHAPPRDPHAFADFARAFARRYGRGGSFWLGHPELPRLPVIAYQVWNEPNFVLFWHPYPSPEAYADLYLAAREALHAADPQAVVVTAGLTASGSDAATGYLRDMFERRPALAGRVDAVAVHPYDARPDLVVSRIVRFRKALDAVGGAGLPLLVTEFGWSTRGDGAVSDDVRGQHLAHTAERLVRSDCGVAGVFPHTLVTQESSPLDREHWFGIVSPAGVARGSALAYAASGLAHDRIAADGPVDLGLCDRRLVATLGAARWHRGAGGRRSRCQPVSATVAGAPAPRARVEYRYRPAFARRPVTRVRHTGHDGRAEACFAARRGRRAARRALQVAITSPGTVGRETLRGTVLLP